MFPETVPEELLPPPILRAYLRRRMTLPVALVTSRRHEVPYHVYISSTDAAKLRAWMDAMESALRPDLGDGGLSTLFSAVWIEDKDVAEGDLRIEHEGQVI